MFFHMHFHLWSNAALEKNLSLTIKGEGDEFCMKSQVAFPASFPCSLPYLWTSIMCALCEGGNNVYYLCHEKLCLLVSSDQSAAN